MPDRLALLVIGLKAEAPPLTCASKVSVSEAPPANVFIDHVKPVAGAESSLESPPEILEVV